MNREVPQDSDDSLLLGDRLTALISTSVLVFDNWLIKKQDFKFLWSIVHLIKSGDRRGRTRTSPPTPLPSGAVRQFALHVD